MNSQLLSFVPAAETTNDHLSDIFMWDFTADQSRVQMASIDTFAQVFSEFYHYQLVCLKLSKRESE